MRMRMETEMEMEMEIANLERTGDALILQRD